MELVIQNGVSDFHLTSSLDHVGIPEGRELNLIQNGYQKIRRISILQYLCP